MHRVHDELDAVTQAIQRAEHSTSGEIVVVVADRSSSYAGVRAVAAALLTMGAALGVWLFVPAIAMSWILALQPLLFVALYFVAGVPWVVRRIVPAEQIEHEVEKLAKAAFVDRGVHRTTTRAGVLLFVSMDEHRVSILGDEGIHRIIGDEGWQQQVRGLTKDLGEGRRIDGVVRAVTSIGALLERHFPSTTGGGENELPDSVHVSRRA